ncbi:hypothetical protein V865_001959 [Kwoniella europaea PYCC6329]|uniref:Shugoshin C-terminal domain-containing protein n=1 Tax=Kwoniella europaea PYCC6329 TaxID=1423913 RepID=A0AAX4KBW3_9TREE
MSQPIAITFHFPPPNKPSSRTLSKRKIATNNRVLSSPYITIDKSTPTAKPKPTPQPITTAESTTSTSTSSSSTAIPISTGSKRRKGPVFVVPSSDKLASLTPLLRPIVDRCSTTAIPSSTEETSLSHHSPSRKRSKKSTPVPTILPLSHHPYSRLSDLSNTRSNVPSPKEVERNKRLEEEKVQMKKENAAIARANAIAKRKSNRKTASGGGRKGTTSRRSSFEQSKPPSPEEKTVPVITTQAASEDGSSPVLGGRSNGLKRTRSQGVIPILTSGLNSVVGSPVIGSPLKEVMSREQEDEMGPRKKSKLSTDVTERNNARRANTHSPVGTPSTLPEGLDVDLQERLTKTVPLSHGQVLPKSVTGGVGLRRTVSGSNSTPPTTFNRAGSVASVGSSDNGRIRRETQLPERLRDYEMKAAI